MKVSSEKDAWTQRYRTALRRYLKRGQGASLEPALRLGRQALALGLETLDVVTAHGQALATLASPDDSSGIEPQLANEAKRFFAEAIVPIEKTHRAAREASVREAQLTETLRQRALESSATTRHLKRGIDQRQASETALTESASRRAALLQQARRLKSRSRQLTRELLSAQESAQKKTSRQLHDNITQTLVAINLRLLTLKGATETNKETLKKEIAKTQGLVKQSIRTINRLAQQLESEHET